MSDQKNDERIYKDFSSHDYQKPEEPVYPPPEQPKRESPAPMIIAAVLVVVVVFGLVGMLVSPPDPPPELAAASAPAELPSEAPASAAPPTPDYITIRGVQYSTSLTGLDLNDMGLTNIDIAPLRHMTNLEYLWLNGNQISNLAPLSGLTNLENLGLHMNRISNLSALSDLTNLRNLGLAYNQISDLTPLSGLTNLETLGLGVNQISDLSPLSGLYNLWWLGLNSNQVVDLTPLYSLTNLNHLGLDYNRISDLAPLSNLMNLTLLSLYDNPIVDWSPIAHVQTSVAGRPEIEIPDKTYIISLSEFSARARGLHAINCDTVGWLYVPNTSIDDVVMWYPNDQNQFYLRRDFYRRWSWEGENFADFRTHWGDFLRESISRNIVIYGNSLDDDPDGPMFAQLKHLQDEQWARNNPYIFFSTLEEDMVWEIFSVKFTNIWVPYNNPNPDNEAFRAIIEDAKARSLWIYDIEVTIEDTIITLTTCALSIPAAASRTGEAVSLTFPSEYRFVVVARLLERDAALTETASLTVNPNPLHAGYRP